MDDRITPRTAIKGFLNAASISKSTSVATRSRVRRSSIPSISNTSLVEIAKRKSQSFSEITPRTLVCYLNTRIGMHKKTWTRFKFMWQNFVNLILCYFRKSCIHQNMSILCNTLRALNNHSGSFHKWREKVNITNIRF